MNKEIIKSNDLLKKGSFTYSFCEENFFDKDKFLELLYAIRRLALDSKKYKKLDRFIAREVFFTYNMIVKRLNGYLLEKFFEEYTKSHYLEHYKYLERLESAVDGFFQGYVREESDFEPFDQNAKL